MVSILIVIGTRPELIKIAPLVLELNKRGLRDQYCIVNTAQHKDLLDPYWEIFDIRPDYVLDIMMANSNLSLLSARALTQLQEFIDKFKKKPTVIVAQGDTTTVMISSVVAFYNKIKFIHLEAGLRSFDFENPFPEEFNRKIAAINCSLHLAPTKNAKLNLISEGYDENKIKVVGNTVVDSLEFIRNAPLFKNNLFVADIKREFPGKKYVLITCHRRENYGDGIKGVINAICQLALSNTEYVFIWPLHPNPSIKDEVLNSDLKNFPNIKITPPLDYTKLLSLMSECEIIISDSGGIQEEAPSFNVPVIVLRDKTERPEGVHKGIAHLVGTDTEKIIAKFDELKNTKLVDCENPYGDGKAASKIVDLLILELNESLTIGNVLT